MWGFLFVCFFFFFFFFFWYLKILIIWQDTGKSHTPWSIVFHQANPLWTFLCSDLSSRTSALSLSLCFFTSPRPHFSSLQVSPFCILYPLFLPPLTFYYIGQYAEHSWQFRHSECFLFHPQLFSLGLFFLDQCGFLCGETFWWIGFSPFLYKPMFIYMDTWHVHV